MRKTSILVSILSLSLVLMAADNPSPKPQPASPAVPSKPSAPAGLPLTSAAAPAAPSPIKLLSSKPPLGTNGSAATTRLPVYVLPEVVVVQLPGGSMLTFVPEVHVHELAKKFRAVRYTNVVIYADGL